MRTLGNEAAKLRKKIMENLSPGDRWLIVSNGDKRQRRDVASTQNDEYGRPTVTFVNGPTILIDSIFKHPSRYMPMTSGPLFIEPNPERGISDESLKAIHQAASAYGVSADHVVSSAVSLWLLLADKQLEIKVKQ